MAVLGQHRMFRDVREWYTRLATLEQQVCLIEDTENKPLGTGFLVGHDLVLTAAHVLAAGGRGHGVSEACDDLVGGPDGLGAEPNHTAVR